MLSINKLFSLTIFLSCAFAATADQELSGAELIERVNARDDGIHVQRRFTVELTNRNGRKRRESTVSYRRYFDDEKRTILFYTEPNNVRGTGFLTFDYANAELDDDQWLYLPALRKVRRISASDRGDYFLGTDFTYEEIKKEQKVESKDYSFTALGEVVVDGFKLKRVEGVPISSSIADELGVSRVVWYIDPDIWMSRKTDYYDQNDNHARTITLEQVEVIDGYLTTTQMFVKNHKTGHSTRIRFEDIDYKTQVPEHLFSQARLRRGL